MKKMPPGNSRSVTEEEKELWKLVTRGDTKLAGSKRTAPIAKKPAHVSVTPALHTAHSVPFPYQQSISVSDTLGQYANMDRNTAERFRKGRYPIDTTLDLHGMTMTDAYNAVMQFIPRQYDYDHRCVLIITGKGKSGEGVLKKSLPLWLRDDTLAHMILAIDVAKAKHGGSGAFYVLLRRRREMT